MPPSLPIEILHNICDILGEEQQKGALKSCALAHRDLHYICQRYIIANINLGSCAPKKVRSFREVLLNNPALARHVKALSLCITAQQLRKSPVNTTLVPWVLEQLAGSVQSLVLASGDGRMPTVTWLELDSHLRLALENTIQSAAMMKLHIDEFVKDMPLPHLLLRVPNLQCLTLGTFLNPALAFTATVEDEKAELVSHLTTLHVSEESHVLLNFLLDSKRSKTRPILDFTTISHLTLSLLGEDRHGITKKLVSNAVHLTYLSLNVSIDLSSVGEVVRSINESSLKTLKTLEFVTVVIGEDDDPTELIREGLTAVRPEHVLEEIRIIMSDDDDSHMWGDGPVWDALVALLRDRTRFPFLKDVNLTVQLSDHDTAAILGKERQLFRGAERSFEDLEDLLGDRFAFNIEEW